METIALDATAEQVAAEAPKKLWGTPLKLKQAEERIAELEAQLLALADGKPQTLLANMPNGMNAFTRVVPETSYPMQDMWPSPPDMDPPRQQTGHQFYFASTVPETGEFVYKETLDFHTDSGYDGQTIFDRVVKMAARAIGDAKTGHGALRRQERLGGPVFDGKNRMVSENSFATLPEFKKDNRIEVLVRIVPAS